MYSESKLSEYWTSDSLLAKRRSQNSLPLPPSLEKPSKLRWWGVEIKERVKPDMTANWQLHLFVDSKKAVDLIFPFFGYLY